MAIFKHTKKDKIYIMPVRLVFVVCFTIIFFNQYTTSDKIQNREKKDLIPVERKMFQELKVKLNKLQNSLESRPCNRKSLGQFGREFVLAFPEVFSTVKEIRVMIVALADGTVTLKSNVRGVNRVRRISAKYGFSIRLPNTLLRRSSYVGRKTVSIKSSTDIAVFGVVLGSSGTGDGYIAIPKKSLEKKYFFSMNQNALLSVVPFYDNTVISFVSKAGTPINLKRMGLSNYAHKILRSGEVLQIKHRSWVMGKVLGSKPFMFLHGSHGDRQFFKYQASHIDSVFYTDAKFFIIPYLYNGTDAVTFCNTKGRQSARSDLSIHTRNNYLYIRGQRKVSYIKTHYQTSCHYIGHGFSVTVPPVTSYTTYCRFLTPYRNAFTHHAVVIVKKVFSRGIMFKNVWNGGIITQNHEENVNVDGVVYSAIYYTFFQGQYEVYHVNPDVPIGVISYGFGKGNTAYGFPVCFKKF